MEYKDFKIKSISGENMTHFDIELNFEQISSFSQRVLLILNTWKNEFAYNIGKGIDYQAILKEDFSSKTLEAFFLYSLQEQLDDFDTISKFEAEFNRVTEEAKINFIAHSKTDETATISNFTI
ncbi:MAG: hypothetical protein EOM78_01535 [Erysipelotrichia bacterium]|nr:hypothetical protein [Erysipelotrichia bacterium]